MKTINAEHWLARYMALTLCLCLFACSTPDKITLLPNPDGSVGNVRVLRGADERLDRFASEAVSQWKFDPATKNGTPVDVEATFQIPFRPVRPGASF